VIADSCAEYANFIFDNYQTNGSLVLVLGAVFFAFQIYGDFSGYSDIAIGTSRLFGFELMRNFSFPYFSRDIAEFWRRWHISLSTWFRDYLYIPLGGSQGGTWMKIRNTFIIFIVSGFWHGANWTFIIWGALNAFYFLPLLLSDNNRKNIEIVDAERKFPSLKNLGLMLFTFGLTVFAWIFFRAESVSHALDYIYHTMSFKFLLQWKVNDSIAYLVVMLLVVFFLIIEWMGRRDAYAIEKLALSKSKVLRWSFYSFLIFLMGMFMQTEETPFIYFQF
jgi:D-alanyl-lipoteichoic acid acyltransferase DltB (MBOAT superfamily)